MAVKYPDINVILVGENGNAYAIIGAVQKAMKRAKIPKAEIVAFKHEAMNGDYDHLLRTAMKWVNVS